MTRRILVGSALLLAFASSIAPASSSVSVRAPAEYRSWTLETSGGAETDLTQLSAPLIATVGLRPNSYAVVSATASSSEWSGDGSQSASLSGVSDLGAQLFCTFPRSRLTVALGATLPTAEAGLDSSEALVAEALAHPLLGMRVKQLGAGFGWNAAMSWTLPVATGSSFGFGIGYRNGGAYTLLEDEDEFTASSEISFTAGAAWERETWAHGRHSAQLRLTYRQRGEDELGGRAIFDEADPLEVALRATNEWGATKAGARIQAVFRGDDEAFADSAGVRTTRTIQGGTSFLFRPEIDHRFGERWRAGVAADWKHLQSSSTEIHNGDSFAIGPTVGLPLGSSAWLRLQASFLMGSFGEGPDRVELRGQLLSLTITKSLVR